ncbi:MAG: LLM class F420-dependent oxidoreductase [Candidatus Rokuibacteriota bacterium]|nr:MAG: LLM class F420-dependent oxidoreductase [Candidatus Rokubacteria bacterium]
MHVGVAMFATHYAMRPDELARELEQRGFESFWVPEHTHIPASRKSPWPGGGDLPKEYWHSYDPFIALTAAATVTTRIKLGTGICLVIERDPIVTAKEVASLDHLSGGRVLFGIGGGWNLEEMGHHGTNPKTRWRLLRERVLAMKELWTKDEAEFHGEFVNFDRSWSYPKPVQKPHPPILMGGDGARTFDRVIEFCDGWLPLGRRPADLMPRIAELRQRAKAAGRSSIPITVFGVRPDARALETLAAAGVDRAVFLIPSGDRETVLPHVDQCAAVGLEAGAGR